MKTFEGSLVASNIKVAIVAARFNEFITSKLIGGAMDGLSRHGVQEADIHLAWVPGAFEIPLVAAKLANSGKYDAVICLGAVIRGSTSHYDYVCSDPRSLRRPDHRHHRAGHRACRHQGRQQGL